jgi:hypothetical protein
MGRATRVALEHVAAVWPAWSGFDSADESEIIFPIPAGVLSPNGENTIANAVWGEQNGIFGLGAVWSFECGNFAGGVPVRMVPAPPAMH